MMIRCENCFSKYDEKFDFCPYCGHEEGSGAAEAFCLPPGTKIAGRYLIGQLLGIGGFGITYKAWDENFENIVAIKEYFPSGLVNRTVGSTEIIVVAGKRKQEFSVGLNRFLEEARNTAKFSKHKNIVNVYDYFEENNTAYFVMEFLDGVTLSEKLQELGTPLPCEDCISIVESVCEALSAVHKENILHRDVSPDNIMLCKDGSVKLFDFGAARFSANAAEDTMVTVIVKPGFAPPEQYDRVNHQDARTDIYALGATLYYALTGCKPEESTNRKIKDELVPPEQLVTSISHNVNNAILRAMAMEQQYRFQTVEEFAQALITEKKIEDPEELRDRKKRRRRRGILGAVAGVAAIFIAFGIRWFVQKDANTLPAAAITVWYIEEGEEDIDRLTGMETITENFMAGYDDIEVEIVGIARDEYEEMLRQAIADGDLPEVFEVTALAEDYSDYTTLLSSVFKKDKKNEYLNNLREELASDLQYPTGMLIPVIYVNTSTGVTLDDTSSLEGITQDASNYLVSDEAAARMYNALYGEETLAASENALELFESGDYAVLLGTSADYFSIKTAMVGHYSILIPDTENATYTYANLWSVHDDLEKEENKVAKAFLAYLLDNVSQEILHYGDANDYAMPVEETALQDYLELYSEFVNAGVTDYLARPYVAPQ
ncbi:MAG: extracellular solute-binding protein [Lachnospiraceae bacterium]|nr:extracellular solute-binding protein [Lachnospiraceae bacterium]